MIRVGKDVSNASPIEPIPAHTAIRIMSIRLTKSPFDKTRRFGHKIQKQVKDSDRSRVSILAWHGAEEVGMPSPVFEPQTTGLLEG